MFHHVTRFQGDPILGLSQKFASDTHPHKVNLGIGVYLNNQRQVPSMTAVVMAKTQLQQHPEPAPYLPMEGLRDYREQASGLVFGRAGALANADRIASVQTLGGSGALRIGADFLAGWFKGAKVWVSGPTWDNHWGIFSGAGLPVNEYPYYSPVTRTVNFSALCAALQSLPPGDVVVLHGCCHNPTGADLTDAQWRQIADIFSQRGLIPFFDMAYQGFGRGLDEDAYAVRHFVEQGLSMLVASSFSKNFSLYGERCGALHIVCPDAEQAETVLSQLQLAVRRSYSSPPRFGSRIVATVLTDPQLRQVWESELLTMRTRMRTMRTQLHRRLSLLNPHTDWSYLLTQQGMFSFTGLDSHQVSMLRKDYGVYLIDSGRLCIAALTEEVVDYVAQAIAQVSCQR